MVIFLTWKHVIMCAFGLAIREDITRTRFSEKAFSVMDKDHSGEVDFIEFVLAVWNYCSFTHTSLVRYAFDLYDLDGSGEIERTEAARCVREIWGEDWERNANAQKVMLRLEQSMEATANGRLTVAMFQEFAQSHPLLLFPAFQLQSEIQQRVLGARFWQYAAKKRGSVNPADLNWNNVQAMSQLSRQSSRKLFEDFDNASAEMLRKKSGHLADSIANLRARERPNAGEASGDDAKIAGERPSSSSGKKYAPNASPTSPTARKKKKKRPAPISTEPPSDACGPTVSSTVSPTASSTPLSPTSPSKSSAASPSDRKIPRRGIQKKKSTIAVGAHSTTKQRDDLVVEEFDDSRRSGNVSVR